MDIELAVDEDVSGFYLIEGLPGTGLVAKIAADYIIDALDMELYAELYSSDVDRVAVFNKQETELRPPVRVFFDKESNLAVLKSDAPVPTTSTEFMEGLTQFIQDNGLKPVLLTGLPIDVKEGEHGVFKTDIGGMASDLDLDLPPIDGGIGGPTGAILSEMMRQDIDAATCIVIESDPRFPDPKASRILIEQGIEPLVDIDIDTQQLEESADQIKKKKKQLAQELQQEEEKSSEAYPREMYH